jgi:UDP-N-acetylglucosamine 2-epimerase (non-hydrolysing)
MKMAPIVLELRRRGIPQILVHTGQHYDPGMSRVFFEELGLPEPDIYLGVGSDTHARQTASIMTGIEGVFRERRPDLVVVAGDVNSTLAAALVSAKESIPLAHVEAGLRSFDRGMPEEVNRVVTDHLSDLLFTTEESGNANLCYEGIPATRIHFVGNCMVDTLKKHTSVAIEALPWERFDLESGSYALLTLHRPSNVDDAGALEQLMAVIDSLPVPVLFPVHPRTRHRLEEQPVRGFTNIRLCDPLPYLAFLGLTAKARFVLTDSGGIQEETTALHVPCLTLRRNTERPITIGKGTNRLVGTDPKHIRDSVSAIVAGTWPHGEEPPLWDGHAAIRIVDVIEREFHERCSSHRPEALAV